MEWLDERINHLLNSIQPKEWMNRWLNMWMNKWISWWFNKWVEKWMNEWMCEWAGKPSLSPSRFSSCVRVKVPVRLPFYSNMLVWSAANTHERNKLRRRAKANTHPSFPLLLFLLLSPSFILNLWRERNSESSVSHFCEVFTWHESLFSKMQTLLSFPLFLPVFLYVSLPLSRSLWTGRLLNWICLVWFGRAP